MDKSTVITYSFNRCCINFFADGELSFQDFTTDETIVLEGIENKQLRDAIHRYIQNLAVNSKSKEWLEELHAEVSSSLALIEARQTPSN